MKKTVIDLIEKMIKNQTDMLERTPDTSVDAIYRQGVKDAYEHSLLLLQDLDSLDD